jgi:DNA-binding Xre family transcriptional regulator
VKSSIRVEKSNDLCYNIKKKIGGGFMSICYKKLWKLLIDNDMSKSELREKTGIAASTISKMNKNQYVSLEVLERICYALDCNIEDIVEIEK